MRCGKALQAMTGSGKVWKGKARQGMGMVSPPFLWRVRMRAFLPEQCADLVGVHIDEAVVVGCERCGKEWVAEPGTEKKWWHCCSGCARPARAAQGRAGIVEMPARPLCLTQASPIQRPSSLRQCRYALVLRDVRGRPDQRVNASAEPR